MFAETRPEAIEDMRAEPPTSLRAELAGEPRHVSSSTPQHQHLERVHGRLRLLAASARAKRSPERLRAPTRQADFRRRPHPPRGRSDYLRRHRDSASSSGIHPRLGPLEDYLGWLRLAKGDGRPRCRAPTCTCTPTGPMENRTHVRHLRPVAPPKVLPRSCTTRASARPKKTPGHRSRGCCTNGVRAPPISPNKPARSARLGSRSSRPPTPAGLRSTATVHVRPHRGALGARRAHWRVVRELQERHRRHHRVSCPLSFIPFQTLPWPYPRRRGDLTRGEPQAHRPFLPPRALRPHDRKPAGEPG